MSINLEYGLFMAEAEGYLDTHEGKVNRMLRDIRNQRRQGVTHMNLNQEYVSQFGLEIEDLTSRDVRRCEQALIG